MPTSANVRLTGSTSGYVELAAPAVAGTTSLTLPATTGNVPVLASGASSGESSSLNISTKPWNMPWGFLAHHSLSTGFSTSSTHTNWQDEGLTVTFTAAANRKLRFSVNVRPYPNGGLQRVNYKIVTGLTDVALFSYGTPDLSATEAPGKTFIAVVDGPTSAGSITYKLQIKAEQANTQVTSHAAADMTRTLSVEDIGPA